MSLTIEDVKAAAARIKDGVHRTPVFTSHTLDEIVNRNGGRVNEEDKAHVFIKMESLQKVGAFKARGALNACLALLEDPARSADVREKGVITHSSGNHGQAVAWAAQACGLPCRVVLPRDTSAAKIAAIENTYKATTVYCHHSERAKVCKEQMEITHQAFIAPYDDITVMAGQGTIGLEMVEQIKGLDCVLVPISGGGLTAGVVTAVKALNPTAKVFIVEPKGKNLQAALESNNRTGSVVEGEDAKQPLSSLADGMRTKLVGELTWPVISTLCEKHVFSVTDDEIVVALKFMLERVKAVVETSGATCLAAVLQEDFLKHAGDVKNIGIIACGGNIDLKDLAALLAK